jgi:citryl-CoA synthetase large subunit
MKLYEKETKRLLADHGVATPAEEGDRYVVKGQVLTTDRAADGGILFADSLEQAEALSEEMRGTEVNGRVVDDVLIEAMVEHDREYYVSVCYDTDVRRPVIAFSTDGGSGVEDRSVVTRPVPDGADFRLRELLFEAGVPSGEVSDLTRVLGRIYRMFREEDAIMVEVNPLARTPDGYVALDGLARLDPDADYRRDRTFPERSQFGRDKTERELRAEAIDKDDHRGVAGKYTELDGDIAMMLAGGGASLTNMDALLAAGGNPANYTEYGGNPPTEKVYRLSKIVLGRPGLQGCWHVGGTANNTDIYRTMKGFCQALEELQPEFPLVVRRDGPNADEGFELLRETRDKLGLEMKLYRNDTPMTQTAETLMEMVG